MKKLPELRDNSSATFLRRVLLADAMTCGATGLLLLLASDMLAGSFGLPVTLLRYVGFSLLPFTAFLVVVATRNNFAPPTVLVVIVLNALWVVASFLLVSNGGIALTGLGRAFIILQAIGVAIFGSLEYLGLKRTTAAERRSRRPVSLPILLCATAFIAGLAVAQPPFESDRFTVTVQGAGPDVILIPGLTSSPEAWRDVAAAVPGYRYHFLQIKGFAGTAPEGNTKGALIAATAEEIARYVATQKIEAPAIIGHSIGGTIALAVAARHSGSAAKLMAVDQLPFFGALYGPSGGTAESVRPVADKLLAQMNAQTPEERRRQTEAMTAAMVGNVTRRPAVIRSALASDPAVTNGAFHEMILTDLRPELTKIAVPVTVLYVTPAGARFDDAQMDEVYRTSYANLKGVKLVRIPESAHFIMFDNPDRFVLEMKAFMQ